MLSRSDELTPANPATRDATAACRCGQNRWGSLPNRFKVPEPDAIDHHASGQRIVGLAISRPAAAAVQAFACRGPGHPARPTPRQHLIRGCSGSPRANRWISSGCRNTPAKNCPSELLQPSLQLSLPSQQFFGQLLSSVVSPATVKAGPGTSRQHRVGDRSNRYQLPRSIAAPPRCGTRWAVVPRTYLGDRDSTARG